ncbi:CAP domain-containing protein [Secundilactobacillus muriivasis]
MSYKTPAQSGANSKPKTPVNVSDSWNTGNHDTAFKFSNQDYVTEFVAKVNQERTQRGLQPLTLNAQLTQISDKRARDIVQNFTHYDSDGQSIFAKYAKQLNVSTAHSEIIAYSMPSTINVDQPTSKDAADNDVAEYIYYDGTSDWGHRDILLNPDYNIIGVSATYTNEDVYDAAILGTK